MNRIEKLLFDKRSPLRRALLEDTDREARLRLLPDIARDMRKAGLISRDLEAETAGYAKRALRGEAPSSKTLITLLAPVAHTKPAPKSFIPNADLALAVASRKQFAGITINAVNGDNSGNAILNSGIAEIAALGHFLDSIERLQPSMIIPVFGYLWNILNPSIRRHHSLQKHCKLFLQDISLPKMEEISGDDMTTASLDTGGVDSYASSKPNSELIQSSEISFGENWNNSFSSFIDDVSSAFQHSRSALAYLFVAVGGLSAWAVAYINASRELDQVGGAPMLRPVTNAISVLAFDEGTSFLGLDTGNLFARTIPMLPWLPLGLYLIVGLFVGLSTMLVISYFYRNSMGIYDQALRSEVISDEAISQKRDKVRAEVVRLHAHAALMPAFVTGVLAAIVWPIFLLLLILPRIKSWVISLIQSVGRFRIKNQKVRETLEWLASDDGNAIEEKDADWQLRRAYQFRAIIAWCIVGLSVVLPFAFTPAIHALTKDLNPQVSMASSMPITDAQSAYIHLSLQACSPGYTELPSTGARYLRLGEPGETGPSRLVLQADDIAATGLAAESREGNILIARDNGTWGLVKRGDQGTASGGFRPVEIVSGLNVVAATPSNAETIVEPAYLNVRLCVREGADLPEGLAAAE